MYRQIHLMKTFDPYNWTLKQLKNFLEKIEHIKDNGQNVSPGDIWSVKKLLFLNYCVDGFLPIFKNYFKNYYYIDTHCGTGLIEFPDELKDVKFPGSPLIAALHSDETSHFTKYYFFDIESNNINILKSRIDTLELKINRDLFNTEKHSFEETVEFIQDITNDSKDKNAFFVVIDPTGFKDIKWKLMKSLLRISTVDIFFIFMTYAIHREKGASKSNPTYGKTLTEFFGNDEWMSYEKNTELVELYKKQLHDYRKFVYDIPIYKKGSILLYNIIITTNSAGAKNVINTAKKLNEVSTRIIENALKKYTGKTLDIDDFSHGDPQTNLCEF